MKELALGRELSRGAFGEVYRGTFRGELVAVKRLTPDRRADINQLLGFLSEAKLMAAMQHERIISFVGVAWKTPLEVHVVTEFMDGGDVRALLRRYKAEGHANGYDAAKLRIAVHVLEALTYLHSLQPQVLHRDLKSRNILLTSTLEAKLIDFGVSRERGEQTLTIGVGTLRWMAPEVMQDGHYGQSADLFSFGIVLSELDTHELPYSVAGRPLNDAQIIAQVSMGTLKANFTEHADAEVVQLARDCMTYEPSERPTAVEALLRLRQIASRF
ncbi:hypothetical protein PINS_up014382 [Pythium insidiosum]|nr:hypothetical protein PINS_up014382 [Pythium insidiosum]